ncbi:MAG: capsid protein [Oscillospiraceae bacterium]|nr:capsid protein [Oscillospiraceae bacterium]
MNHKMFSLFQWIRKLSGDRPEAPAPAAAGGMESAIEQWARMYRGGEAGSLGLPATIAAEFARLVTLEMRVNLSGSPRADFLSAQLRNFLSGIRVYAEYGCALGGVVFKPYACNDAHGKSISRIVVDAVQADCFIPTAFDTSNRMTGAIFIDQLERDGRLFTRLEKHEYAAGRHTVTNRAFAAPARGTAGSQNDFTPVSLSAVPEWAALEPEMTVNNVDRPLFAYFRVPFANPIDRRSPLGVSVFSRAAAQIADADAQYARLMWEFEGGELAVDAEEGFVLDGAYPGGLGRGGGPLPKNRARLFRGVCSSERDFYRVFSPALRDASLLNGFNAILRMIEWQCGLVYGTLSDPRLAERTAQEVKASRQRSYAAVLDIQYSLQYALDDLIYAMNALATLYGMAPEGEIDAAYEWDDSIIVDPESWVEGMRRDTEIGLLRPELYIAKKYGVTLAQAANMMGEEVKK